MSQFRRKRAIRIQVSLTGADTRTIVVNGSGVMIPVINHAQPIDIPDAPKVYDIRSSLGGVSSLASLTGWGHRCGACSDTRAVGADYQYGRLDLGARVQSVCDSVPGAGQPRRGRCRLNLRRYHPVAVKETVKRLARLRR